MPPPPRPPFPPPTGVFSHHSANCHCGKIRYSFSISPPLSEYPAVSCNCSICRRNGYLLVYPTKEYVKLEGADAEASLGSYNFGKNMVTHKFCKGCGSSVFFEIEMPPPEAAAAAEAQGVKIPTLVGVNLRMVPGLDFGKLTIKQVEGPEHEPKNES